jgi:predicted alpha/beta hydrolase family esterase
MKVLILHGWGGSDYPHWQAQLAAEVAKNYGTVSFPLIQHPHYPNRNRWIKQVKAILDDFKPDTVVCHSLANTLWFWLTQEDIAPVERLFMVSPPSLNTDEQTIKTFFPCPLPQTLKAREAQMFVSDNDPWITTREAEEIAQHYHIPLTILHNAGHINADSGYGKWEEIEQLVMRKTSNE